MDIGTLTGQIALEDQVSGQLNRVLDNVENFAKSFGGAMKYATIAAAGLTAAVGGAITSIGYLATAGDELIGVENAFNNLAVAAGSTGEALMEGLNEGLKNTVDSMELMKSTNVLLTSGMQLSGETMETLAATAREMAKATGGEAADSLQTLSSALAMGNTRLLRRQGILVDVKTAEEEYAKAHGTTREQLTQTGKLEAVRSAMLDAMRGKLRTLGESELNFTERLNQSLVSIGNWVDELRKAVATSPHVLKAFDTIKESLVSTFGGDAQNMLKTIVGWIDKFADAVTSYGPIIITTLKNVVVWVIDIITQVKNAWSLVPDWFKNIAKDAALTAGAIYLTNRAMSGVAGAIGGASTDIVGTVASFATITSGLKDLGSVMATQGPKVIGYFKGIGEAFALAFSVGAMDRMNAFTRLMGGIGGVLEALGSAAMIALGSTTGLVALFTSLGVAAAALGTAFYDLFQVMIRGQSVWDFFFKARSEEELDWLSRTVRSWIPDWAKWGGEVKKADDSLKGFSQTFKDFQAQQERGATVRKPWEVTTGASPFAVGTGDFRPGMVEGGFVPPEPGPTVISHAEEYAKRLEELRKQVRYVDDDLKLTQDLFKGLSAAQKQNADVLAILIPRLDQLVASGRNLTAAQQAVYESAMQMQTARLNEEAARLQATGVTVALVAELENQGRSQANIATQFQVTAQGLSRYITRLKEVQKATEEVTAAQDANRAAQRQMQGTAIDTRAAVQQRDLLQQFQSGIATAEEYAQRRFEIDQRHDADRVALTLKTTYDQEEIERRSIFKRMRTGGDLANAETQAQQLLAEITKKYADQRVAIHEAAAEQIAAAESGQWTKVIEAQQGFSDLIKKMSMSDTDFQIDQMEKATEERIRNSELQGEALKEFSRVAWLETSALSSKMKFDATGLKEHTMAARFETYMFAKRTLDLALADEKAYTPEYIEELKKREQAAREAVTGVSIGTKIGRGLEAGLLEAASAIPGIVSNAIIHDASWEETGAAIASTIGAAVGGHIGQAVGGPIGKAIGEAAGSMVGMLVDAFHKSAGEDVMRRVGRDWGVTITEEMGNAIAEDAKNMFGGSRQAAEIFNLSKILDVAGGLSSDNLDIMTHKLRDVFSMLQTGAFTSAQAVDVLNDNFSEFANFFGDGIVSKGLREVIALTQREGLEVKAITDFLQKQAERARKGLEGILAGSLRYSQEGGVDTDFVTARFGQGEVTQEQFDRFSRLTTVAFQAAIAAGEPFLEVIAEMQDQFRILGDTATTFGFEQSAAFGDLSAISAFFSENEELGRSIQGTNDMLVALANSNLMTQQTFSDLGTIAVENYNAMIEGGLTNDQALLAQQQTLQTLWELMQEGTFTVDEQTQALIDQAQEAGLVGEAHMDASERAAAAMDRAATAMEKVATALQEAFGLGEDAATNFVDTTLTELDKLPTRIEFEYVPTYVPPEVPEGAAGGHQMAFGGAGVATQPTTFTAGEAGPEPFWFGGGGAEFPGNEDLLDEIRGLRGDMKTMQRSQARIMRDELLTAPKR